MFYLKTKRTQLYYKTRGGGSHNVIQSFERKRDKRPVSV